MNKLFLSPIRVVYAMLSVFLNPAFAQTAAPGPYYAVPSWDQTLQCDTQATCPRFIVLKNFMGEQAVPGGIILVEGAAVLDRETGLVWERSPSDSSYNWYSALFRCMALNTGRGGWRLPTAAELRSLHVFPSSALPPGHPFDAELQRPYWSVSPYYGGSTDSAWTVQMSDGQLVAYFRFAGSARAWCVRGGQGVEPH